MSNVLSIRIFDISSYQNNQVNELDIFHSNINNKKAYSVPILRIFGRYNNGPCVCLNIHRVFPYFYIPLVIDHWNNSLALELAEIIDNNLLNNDFQKNMSHNTCVFDIQVIEAKSIYGYNEKPGKFLKICLFNQFSISKLADLFLNGRFYDQILQPFEVHIPYTLQFMIDYGLFGMDYINISTFSIRNNIPVNLQSDFKNYNCTINSLKNTSKCKVECDCNNTEIIKPTNSSQNPGINQIWELEKIRRRTNLESSYISQHYSPISSRKTPSQDDNLLNSNDSFEQLKILISDVLSVPSLQYANSNDNHHEITQLPFNLNSQMDQSIEADFFQILYEMGQTHEFDVEDPFNIESTQDSSQTIELSFLPVFEQNQQVVISENTQNPVNFDNNLIGKKYEKYQINDHLEEDEEEDEEEDFTLNMTQQELITHCSQTNLRRVNVCEKKLSNESQTIRDISRSICEEKIFPTQSSSSCSNDHLNNSILSQSSRGIFKRSLNHCSQPSQSIYNLNISNGILPLIPPWSFNELQRNNLHQFGPSKRLITTFVDDSIRLIV